MDEFWKKFRQQYLTSLLKRPQWQTTTKNLKVGDMVIIVEDITPREHWRVARVVEITNTDATHARRLKLRDAHGVHFDRHTNGVIRIEID